MTSNVLHCLSSGASLGWLIDPTEQIVLIYRPNQLPLSLEAAGDRLLTPDFANGLELTVQQLFDWLKVD